MLGYWTLSCFLIKMMVVLSIQEDRCNEPPPVPNTYRIWEGGADKSWVKYSCYHGYSLISGDLSRQCDEGQYTGNEPVCVFDCGRPTLVYGADVNFTERVGNIRSTMTFNCWENYTQVDSVMTVPCNDYMQRWTNEPARCKSPENLAQKASVFTLTSSGKFVAMSGGRCVSTERMYDPLIRLDIATGDEFYEISEVIFKLPEYTEVLPINISITLRKSESSWTIPNCGYPEPGAILRDKIIKVNCSLKAIGQSVAIIGQYKSSTAAILSVCDVEIYGRLHIVDCGQPGFIHGAKAHYKDTLFRSKATYECEPNFYTLYQGAPATCLFFNVWNYDKIICTDEANVLLKRKGLDKKGLPLSMITDNLDSTCTMLGLGELSGWKIEFGVDNYEIRQILLTLEYGGENVWKDMVVSVKSKVEENICQINPAQSPALRTRNFICHSYPIGTAIFVDFRNSSTVNLCEIRAFGDKVKTQEIFECLRTESGRDYKGFYNHTISGAPCSNWFHHYDSLRNEFVDIHITEGSLEEMVNYCRNPEGIRSKPWCYTNNNQDSWEFCPLINCQLVCSLRNDGADFVGKLAVTKSGKDCQVWSLVDRGRPRFAKVTFANADDEHNYCRNPGISQSRPWCYTDSITLDYEQCLLPKCPVYPLLPRKVYTEDDESVNDRYEYCAKWVSENPKRMYQLHNYQWTSAKLKRFCERRNRNATLFCLSGSQTGLKWQYILIHCLDDPTTTTSLSDTTYFNKTSVQPEWTSVHTTTPTRDSCGCQMLPDYGNITTIELVRERIINITTQLTIPKETLSSTIRRRNCAKDERPSVSCVGYGALAILFLVVIIITIPDIIQVFLFIRSTWINPNESTSHHV